MTKITKIIILILLILLGITIFGFKANDYKNQDQEIILNNDLQENPYADLIVVSYPEPNDQITSPVTIYGQARGYWFFEASFPVKILDDNNNVIAQGIAVADGEWMTEEFVPFVSILEFTKPLNVNNGTLILERDNPSGLPENDAQIQIPVVF